MVCHSCKIVCFTIGLIYHEFIYFVNLSLCKLLSAYNEKEVIS